MKTELIISYPAPVESVMSMLSNPEYQRTRVQGRGLEKTDVSCGSHGSGHRIILTGVFPQNRVPAQAKRFIRGPISFTTAETWTPRADETYAGTLTADLSGLPVAGGAAMVLRPGKDAQSCEQVIDLEFTVSVPLLGRRIEQEAVDHLGVVVRDEEKRAAQWLAQQ